MFVIECSSVDVRKEKKRKEKKRKEKKRKEKKRKNKDGEGIIRVANINQPKPVPPFGP
jgi:phosphoenolpyruvate-protein kinase (PTS system EI component)